MAKDTLTTAELADRWGLTEQRLRAMRLTSDGPPYFKPSSTKYGRVLYRLADIEAWEKRGHGDG